MIFVPIPFVVSLLLGLVLLRRWRQGELTEQPFFSALIGLYAVLCILIGLRWGYGLRAVLPVQSVLAAAWAPLAWLSFRPLWHDGPPIQPRRDWPHALPPLIVVILILLWPAPIDITLIVVFAAYGAALARQASRGAEALWRSRIAGMAMNHGALWITALGLALFAAVDLAISLNIRLGDGHLAPLAVALANVPALLVIGLATTAADPPPTATATPAPDADTTATLDDIRRLLSQTRLYRDPDLTLARLARRLGVPARQVSQAINRGTGQNLSQFINAYRVADVCDHLRDPDTSVTTAMYAAGFLTKSNFNREFRRVTGQSPTDWRAALATPSATP